MAQVNPSLYVKPYWHEDRSDGWYIERSTGDLVAFINGAEVSRISAATGAESITLADGKIFVGSPANAAEPVSMSGNATISNTGAVSVSNLTIASEARGDLLRRGTTVWERLAAKTAGSVIFGDGNDIISGALSGDVTAAHSGGALATTIGAGKVVSSMLAEGLLRYAEVTIAAADITDTGAGKFGHANGYPLVAAPGDGKVVEFVSALITYDYAAASYGGGGDVGVAYTGWGAVSGVVSAANSIGAAGDKNALVLPAVPTNNQALNNVGLSLVAAAPFTQPGTAAGVMRVKCLYRVHATGL